MWGFVRRKVSTALFSMARSRLRVLARPDPGTVATATDVDPVSSEGWSARAGRWRTRPRHPRRRVPHPDLRDVREVDLHGRGEGDVVTARVVLSTGSAASRTPGAASANIADFAFLGDPKGV